VRVASDEDVASCNDGMVEMVCSADSSPFCGSFATGCCWNVHSGECAADADRGEVEAEMDVLFDDSPTTAPSSPSGTFTPRSIDRAEAAWEAMGCNGGVADECNE